MSEILATAAQVGGVQRLAIVDYAYDPPGGDEISEDAFNRLVQALEDNPDQMREATQACGLTAENLDDWEQFTANDALIRALWNLSVGAQANATLSAGLKQSLDVVFSDVHVDRISKLQELRPLETLLGGMGVSLMKLGADPEPDVVAAADVVFLDLFLSSDVPSAATAGGTPRSVLDRARERALGYVEAVRSVTANNLEAVPPAFVLISSMGTAQIASNFRRKAAQTASRFRFISKQAIERQDPQGLLTIAEILRTCRASAVVEPLRKAWPLVVEEAKAWVAQRLVDLDISDFARLYELSLGNEGQLVQDYVKELVAGALAERVACAFTQHQPTVGDNPFADAPSPYMQAPSNAFAELYGATRLTGDRGYRGPDDSDPMSGDLYLEGQLPKRASTALYGRTICAVMTPICDLLSRGGGEPAATSVLLLEGTLEPTYHKHKLDTQMVSLGGRFYEIDWATKRPLALPLTNLRTQVRKKEKMWLGRLKSEHFLALQSEYLASFARVGLLKSPGVFEPLAGRICVREAGSLVTLGDAFDGKSRFAFQSPDRKNDDPTKQPVFFTGEFLDRFRSLLTATVADGDRSANTRTKAQGLLERMNQVVDLVKRLPPAQHTISDYLRVVLLPARSAEVSASQDGVLLIVIWKP